MRVEGVGMPARVAPRGAARPRGCPGCRARPRKGAWPERGGTVAGGGTAARGDAAVVRAAGPPGCEDGVCAKAPARAHRGAQLIPSAAEAPSMKRPELFLTRAAALTRCGPRRGLRGGGLRGRGGAGPLLLAGGLACRRHGLPAVRRHGAQALRAVQRREGEGARWWSRALSRCAASWNAHGADACVLSLTTLHHHHDNARTHARAHAHTHTHTYTPPPLSSR